MAIVLGTLVIGLYLSAFLCMGMLFPARLHNNRILNLFLLGFPAYFGLFQITALPLKILKKPLHLLTLAWGVLMLLVILFILLFRRKTLVEALKDLGRICRPDIWRFLFVVTVLALGVLLALNVNHISTFDEGFYIGLPVSSVYSDTIELMDPYSGRLLDHYAVFYFLNTVTVHSAVMFQALGLHPLVEQNFTLTITLVIVFSAFLYRAGCYLFKGERRAAVFFTWISILVLMFTYSIAGTSHYFAYRTYEGKAIVSYLLPVAVFVFALGVYYEKNKSWGWLGLVLISICGAAFSNTAFFIIPVEIATVLTPSLLLQKRWKEIPLLALACTPSAAWALLYMMR
ncbi:MAG: hypothetical protein K6C06_01080 [Lachnospiraceae bacterium]|nr:hypothetical protein [Lachnospiraceae bacterium]